MVNGDGAETTKCPRIHTVALAALILSIVVPMLLAAVLPVRADFT